jgi:hypothetical protein
MHRFFTFILVLLTSVSFAQQNALTNTRWGCYMGGPGGGYLGIDYYFAYDTVYSMFTTFPSPAVPLYVYTVDGNTATFSGTPTNSTCVHDIDTFSFTIVGDTLDFVDVSASCQSQVATFNPYYFIRTQGTGINNSTLPLAATIYPNPAHDNIYIIADLPTGSNYTLNIYTITGALVKTEGLTDNIRMLNISMLSPGIYIAEIKSSTHMFKQKITIQ